MADPLPFYKGKVNVSLVAHHPENRSLLMKQIQVLETSMMDMVLDIQYPLILASQDPAMAMREIKSGKAPSLICYAGHHRLEAFKTVCLLNNDQPVYEAVVYSLLDDNVEDFLLKLSINTVTPHSVPDYHHVLFKKLLVDLEGPNWELTAEEFKSLRLKSNLSESVLFKKTESVIQ